MALSKATVVAQLVLDNAPLNKKQVNAIVEGLVSILENNPSGITVPGIGKITLIGAKKREEAVVAPAKSPAKAPKKAKAAPAKQVAAKIPAKANAAPSKAIEAKKPAVKALVAQKAAVAPKKRGK